MRDLVYVQILVDMSSRLIAYLMISINFELKYCGTAGLFYYLTPPSLTNTDLSLLLCRSAKIRLTIICYHCILSPSKLPHLVLIRLQRAVESLAGVGRTGSYGAGWWMVTFPGFSGQQIKKNIDNNRTMALNAVVMFHLSSCEYS